MIVANPGRYFWEENTALEFTKLKDPLQLLG